MKDEQKFEKILRIPIYLTIVLIVAKFIIYKIGGSLTIFSLFADSFFDFIGSSISLIAYKYSTKDKTDKYQYGFYGIVDISTIVISTIILFTSFFIYVRAIQNILNKNVIEYDFYSIIVMALSTIISLVLGFVLKIIYNRSKLLIIKGEIAHYVADGFTNGGALVALLICRFVYNHYLIDPVIAMIMGYIVAKPAFEILLDAVNNILSKEVDDDIKNKIVDTINKEESVLGYDNFKTRRSGERVFVQIYLKIKKELSFEKVHDVVDKLEGLIEKNISNSEVIIHACPK
jgi:ferrous-iron efflux pump FieF